MGAAWPPATTLVGSAITLALGVTVAGVLYAMGDAPSGYFDSPYAQTLMAALAALAAPVALLVAWDEIDLSSIGTIALGGYVYAEVNDDSVVPGLVAAAGIGLAIGAAIGLVRWLSGAQSALVSLAGGTVTFGLALELSADPVGGQALGSRIDGAGLAILAALASTGLAIGMAVLLRAEAPSSPAPSASTPATTAAAAPGPRVVPAFALSGLAGAAFGAFVAGSQGFYMASTGTYTVLVLVFTAVAIGGAVRGSGPLAPPLAALGAVVAVVVQDSTRFNGWSPGSDHLALGGLFLACVLVANVLRRVLAPSRPAGPL